MKYPKLVHWAEGLFLQPHHFQQMQKNFLQLINAQMDCYNPYAEGIFELEFDEEALRAQRLVINKLSALMPDGTAISYPYNCDLLPINLEFSKSENDMMVYLAIPSYSENRGNLDQGNGEEKRYKLHEDNFVDANTGDNEVAVFTKIINARLITDLKLADGCTVLPLLKFNWVFKAGNDSILEVDQNYTPPTVLLDPKSNLFNLVNNFVYELKNCKTKIISDIDAQGFDVATLNGSSVLKLLILQNLNTALERLRNRLLPNKVTPLILFEILSEFLSQLKSLNPLHDQTEIPLYDHHNLFFVFSQVIAELRNLLRVNGKAECVEIEFVPDENNKYQKAIFTEENLQKGKDYYIALQGINDWKKLIADIEEGDNFRLLDVESLDSRIRGIKLTYVRFPPRFLPIENSDTVFFKVMREESPRIWQFIAKDHQMVIDYAHNIFNDIKAKLFITEVDSEASN